MLCYVILCIYIYIMGVLGYVSPPQGPPPHPLKGLSGTEHHLSVNSYIFS